MKSGKNPDFFLYKKQTNVRILLTNFFQFAIMVLQNKGKGGFYGAE